MKKYDVTVIGSGPGGYVAAIRCAQLGMKVAIIEKYNSLGGTCLNVGCIPSKALLDSSEHFYNASQHFPAHGIVLKGLTPDLGQMMKRKTEVVKANVDGIQYLMKKNKIDVFTGHGRFEASNLISIDSGNGKSEKIETSKTIIATGSKPAALRGIEIDKKRIITSTEALTLSEIPKHLVIVGGGVIGLELGSVYARLGSKVTVLEFTDAIIGTMDRGLGKELQKCLQKIGFQFYLGHKVTSADSKGKSVQLKAENTEGKKLELEGDVCLVSVGRKPYTDNLGLEKAGIRTDAAGRIPVNENLETAAKGIYAIGDVIEGPMLAHKAEEEGVFAAEKIANRNSHINYNHVPSVVYTWPEVAGVGFTEEELKENKVTYKSGSFPFKASGRARASMDTDGFVKVLAHSVSGEILGVHIIGARAADLIAEAVLAMEYRATAERIGEMCHAHPTYSEAFKEACLAAAGNRAIHI